jgi:hypothetical protein
MLTTAIIFLLGVLVGLYIGAYARDSCKTYGVLRIDHNNSEKDLYRFEIDDLESLDTKTQIVLKIDHNADLTRK